MDIKKLIPMLFWVMCSMALPVYGLDTLSNIDPLSSKMAQELIAEHAKDPDFVILDIRTAREFNTGHLPGAIMIDFFSKTFSKQMERLDKSKSYLIYCRSGYRSTRAITLLRTMGFTQIYHMHKGIREWNVMGYPLQH